MAYEQLTLADLRAMALVYATGSETSNRWGKQVNAWLNEGLRRFWQGQDGVEDVTEFQTVIGERLYPMPQGIIYVRKMMCNGSPIEYRELQDQDYYAQGNARPGWYTPYGNQLYLGPQPSDSVYTILLWYTRAPYAMLTDTAQPDIPALWRTSIAKYAAGMIALAERDMTQAQALLGEFAFEKKDFEERQAMKTLDNFLTVGNPMGY